MITGWLGRKRSGKTMGMTSRLLRAAARDRTIYSNYWLDLPNVRKINASILEGLVKDEIELYDCAMGVDEIHVLLDPRASSSIRNRRVSYLLTQTGKRNVDFHYTTQFQRQVEVRLWDNTERLVYPCPLGQGVYLYTIYHGPSGDHPGRKIGYFTLRGERYYNRYDTSQIIHDYIPDKVKTT